MNNLAAVSAIVVLAGVAGSVSTDALQPDVGGISLVVQGKSYDELWAAAEQALGADMRVVVSHKASGALKARTGAAPVGKVVGIFIQPPLPRAREYTVNIVSRRPFQALRPGHDSEPQVARDFMAALEPAGHGGAAAPALLPR
jgi:hypothetical protein